MSTVASAPGAWPLIGHLVPLVRDRLAFLRRLHHHAASSLAIALDVNAWAPHLPVDPALDASTHLSGTGWRSVTLGPRDRLDVAWQELGLMQVRSTASAGARP